MPLNLRSTRTRRAFGTILGVRRSLRRGFTVFYQGEDDRGRSVVRQRTFPRAKSTEQAEEMFRELQEE